jgi:Zn-dependent metalloprotease
MKNIAKSVIGFVLVFSLCWAQDSTQVTALDAMARRLNKPIYVHWRSKVETPDIISFGIPYKFDKDKHESASQFIDQIKGLLRYRSGSDELRPIQERRDGSATYFKFQQYYKGVAVRGGEYVVEVTPDGGVQSVVGLFRKQIHLDPVPSISLGQAVALARQGNDGSLTDSLLASQLLIAQYDDNNVLVWELKMASEFEGTKRFEIDAQTGAVLFSGWDEVNNCGPIPGGSIFPRHPGLDGFTPTHVAFDRLALNGYLEGTYAKVLVQQNDYFGRDFNSSNDFSYSFTNTGWDVSFDQANLYYHIDRYRSSFVNALGFSGFGQIVAYAYWQHDGSDFVGNNAKFDPTTFQLHMGSGADIGPSRWNSTCQEDVVIYHEYTHALSYSICSMGSGDNETGAISEGTSDYLPGSFVARSVHAAWVGANHPTIQRDMNKPVIWTYQQYQQYTSVETHAGGTLWSSALWNLRNNPNVTPDVGTTPNTTDRLVFRALYGLPSNPSFLQFRQKIMDADRSLYAGSHLKHIAHTFFLKGIGTDSVSVYISGPSSLAWKSYGTWTANPSNGDGGYTYEWRWRVSGNPSWSDVIATTQSYRMLMQSAPIELLVTVGSNGQQTTAKYAVSLPGGGARILAEPGRGNADKQAENSTEIASTGAAFSIGSFPNPFNPSTTLAYQLTKDATVKLEVYDLIGRKVRNLVDESNSAGYYRVVWDGRGEAGEGLASGVYLYRFSATLTDGSMVFARSGKLVLIR